MDSWKAHSWYPITAASKKSSTIALSGGEAEMVSALSGVAEAWN